MGHFYASLTPAQATLIAGCMTVFAALLAALLAFVANVGTRQHAIREADLLQKLQDLKLEKEYSAVEVILRRRIARWSSPGRAFLRGIGYFFTTLSVMSAIAILVICLEPVKRLGLVAGLDAPIPVVPVLVVSGGVLLSGFLAWLFGRLGSAE